LSRIQDLYVQGTKLLGSFPEPSLEVKLLLLKCASLSEEEFFSHPEKILSRSQEKHYNRLLKLRLSGVPMAYLLGEKEFWSLSFQVFPGVLIPRPETELIVEKVIGLSSKKRETIIDIGTGCGNIAVSLAKELPLAEIIASDISRKAMKAARMNARAQGISRIKFRRGDLFMPLMKLGLENSCDFIVSNPPYVSRDDWASLSSEIKEYEPSRALIPGETGTELIEKLINGAPAFLKKEGYLIFEIGKDQKKRIISLFGPGWKRVECVGDLSGIPRVIAAQRDKI
jgi:release factor glutamine methyltransferase